MERDGLYRDMYGTSRRQDPNKHRLRELQPLYRSVFDTRIGALRQENTVILRGIL